MTHVQRPSLSSGPHLVTFGCRLNTYESQVIKELGQQAGLNNTIIVNTCSVTAEAERQARQSIRKLRKENPTSTIIVTGCAAQVRPEQFAQMPEVDRVVGNADKLKRESYQEGAPRVLVNDIFSVEQTASHLVTGFDGRSRAYLQVQNGCNHRCTFCQIPLGRGNSRSVPLGVLVDQVRLLVEQGYQEVVLTGVDITSYGEDLPGHPTLGQMIRRLLAMVPDLPWVRLSSLDPVEIDEDLWRLIEEEPRLVSHLHLSLQAGDNMILKRMKRRHLREDAIAFCERARRARPAIAFGADLIAGFPTETEAMFENTLRSVEECGLTYLHVFPYSPRPGTPASRMPQVSVGAIKDRARRLREKGAQCLESYFKSLQGQKVSFLIEEKKEKGYQGKTDTFASIHVFAAQELPLGRIVQATVQGYTLTHLQGIVA